MIPAPAVEEKVEVDSYLTDGRRLFLVVDVLESDGALLEDVSSGRLSWHGAEELGRIDLRRVEPAPA